MKTNQIKSITIHSAYGVEVEYKNGRIYTIVPTHCGSDHEKKTLGVNCAIKDVERGFCKILLHSLDKLITNILEDENDFFYQMNNDLCDILGTSDCEYFVKSLIKGDYYAIDVNKAKEAFNYLLEKGYNVFGLSSEYVKEKAISKNNGSRDIGLVDMMDIDTY